MGSTRTLFLAIVLSFKFAKDGRSWVGEMFCVRRHFEAVVDGICQAAVASAEAQNNPVNIKLWSFMLTVTLKPVKECR